LLPSEDFDDVSALQDMVWQKFLERRKTWTKLRGGNDQLPKAFAQRLGNRVHYGAAVQRVTQNKDKVRLSVSRAGLMEQVEADRVILAVPSSVLRLVCIVSPHSARQGRSTRLRPLR
jgi:monoamine oxidase